MTFPISIEDQSYLVGNLSLLRHGEEAFYGQLYPDVYPSDAQDHEAFVRNARNAAYYYHERTMLFGRFVTSLAQSGVLINRLRALPVNPDADTEAMVAMCYTAQDNGESVRVCRLDQQLGRMALANVDGNLTRKLLAPVPRGSFWALHYHGQDQKLVVGSVAMIDYQADGTYPNLQEFSPPSEDLRLYAAFWRDVHQDPRQSRPLFEWRQLYD